MHDCIINTLSVLRASPLLASLGCGGGGLREEFALEVTALVVVQGVFLVRLRVVYCCVIIIFHLLALS